MAHVLPASIQEMIVHYVCIPRSHAILARCSYFYLAAIGKCGHSFHMVRLQPCSLQKVGSLIVSSIASSLGYKRRIPRGSVLCADEVCFLALEGSGSVR